MISISSIKGNIIPNVYTKNIALNSTYVQKAAAPSPGFYDKSYGNVGLGFSSDTTDPKTTISDIAMANLTLSVKFLKNKNYKNDLLLLLDDEISNYIKIYVHQITSKVAYQTLLQEEGEYASAKKIILTTEHNEGGKDIKTKMYSYSDLVGLNAKNVSKQEEDIEKENAHGLIEQILDDGTTLLEGILETDFAFNKDIPFLAYVLVPAVSHPDIDETILGNITADILILDGQFQNQGLIFKIAPTLSLPGSEAGESNITTELLNFGNPGDIWAGPVHEHNGRYMAGATHNPDVPHPLLDYDIVPATKFVDNRTQEKIEKNIVNVTKVFEKANSLTTKYKNSSLNLADFSSYKKMPFISDIWLTHDSNLDVQGAFIINKRILIKENSAFPFLFNNIEDMIMEPSKKKIIVKNLLDKAELMRLKIFENGKMMDTISLNGFSTLDNLAYAPRDSRRNKNIKTQMITSKDNFKIKTTEELEEYSFRVYNHNNRIGDFTYKVEVDYKDPTIEFVKSFLPLINKASISVSEIITRAQMQKEDIAKNVKSGFDLYTKRINPDIIELFKNEEGEKLVVMDPGGIFNFIKPVLDLAANTNFKIFFHSPSWSRLGESEADLSNYLYDLACLDTAVLDSLMVLQKFLNNLATKVYDVLNSFGAKPIKISSKAGSEYAVKQSSLEATLSNKVINGSSAGSLHIFEYGYDFTGFISKNTTIMNTIKSDSYNAACLAMLQQLVTEEESNNAELLQGALNKQIMIKLKPDGWSGHVVKVSSNAFSGFNIPVTAIKSCVSLPKTVLDIDSKVVTIENIFTSIIKFNNELFVNNSNRPTVKNSVRKDLDSIFNNFFGARMSDGEQKSLGVLDKILVSGTKAGVASDLDDFDPGQSANKPSLGISPKGSGSELANPNNFLLLSLLTKMLLGQTDLKPKMSLPDFAPLLSEGEELKQMLVAAQEILKAPLQVKCLSIYDNEIGPLKDFLNTNQFYIRDGIINPLFLCYYWFIHQNLAVVHYLDGFEETTDSFEIRNEDNPYTSGKTKTVKEINMKSPKWNMMSLDVLSKLKSGEKLLCKIVKYENSMYIDNKLARALNLPLRNNYFIVEGN